MLDRNVLGTLNLGDILSQRESIAREMQVLSQPTSRARQKKIQKSTNYKKYTNTQIYKYTNTKGKCRYLAKTSPARQKY